MVKIMLVDDEPPFLEELTRMIAASGRDCEVVYTAHSGRQAFEMIPLLKPEIIFCDIVMPVMNGVELAKAVHENYPEICLVIVSGYPSFEYARETFKAEVYDYLLKPLKQQAVHEILTALLRKVRETKVARCGELLRELLFSGKLPVGSRLQTSFNAYSLIFMAGPLFAEDASPAAPFDCGSRRREFDAVLRGYLNEAEEYWLFNSAEGGKVIAFGLESYRLERMKAICAGIEGFCRALDFPVTLGFGGNIPNWGDIGAQYRTWTALFTRRIVTGRTQIIDLREPWEETKRSYLSAVEEATLSQLILGRNWERLREELNRLFDLWEREGYPQYCVTEILGIIVVLLERHGAVFGKTDELARGRVGPNSIGAMAGAAKSIPELREVFWARLGAAYTGGAAGFKTGAAADLFPQIAEFIATNLARPLTLADIGAAFGISQSRLCNLFRDRTGMSFVEYLTAQRMEKSKELLRSGMPVKAVAAIVGYPDQHYFSRVFKSYTRQTPSEYRDAGSRLNHYS